ncbi:MAG TPA: guanylate kinase [bacterium]
METKGLLVVISAPSGAGKTSVIRKVLATGDERFRYSISATTRARRGNERPGEDYFFLSPEDFDAERLREEFVEWAEVHGHYYATPKTPLDKWLAEGGIVFLDLDVDGGLAIKDKYNDTAILIFINPPSYQSLVDRLRSRETESQAQIDKRLERYPKEMQNSQKYDYRIVNEQLDATVKEIIKIVNHHIDKINRTHK